MDFALAADFPLTDAPHHRFVRLRTAEALAPCVAALAPWQAWSTGLKLTEAPSAAELAQLCLEEQRLALWRVESQKTGAALGLASISTVALDWHVHYVGHGAWLPGHFGQVVDHLANAAFSYDGSARAVWTALPLPEPEGGEEALARAGFTVVPSSLDRDRQRTYGLFREIWRAYRGQD